MVAHRIQLAYFGMATLLLASMIASLGVGAVQLTPYQVVAALLKTPVKASHVIIVWDFRLARVLLVSLCGAALATAGTAFQGLFRNPLADPFVVGASSGAALGATLAVIFSDRTGVSVSIGMGGFIGAVFAVFLVYAIAESSNYGSIAALLLAGSALSTMFSAIVSLLLLFHDEALHSVFAWLLGGFAGRSWPHLEQAMLIAPVGMIILWLMSRPLDALSGGDESAEALGLNLRQIRFIIIVGASLVTAAAVAAGGIISFVGLIAPHLARTLFGASHARLYPAAMLLGALLLIIADDLARTVMAPIELPIGIFTALLGGPFFLFLLHSQGKRT